MKRWTTSSLPQSSSRTALLAFAFVVLAASHALSQPAAEKGQPQLPLERLAATRLQVFLDRAGFGPGKIDGRYGEFTHRALALYREARQETPATGTEKTQETDKNIEEKKAANEAPDVLDLDLASVEPAFIDYRITEADPKLVGEMPPQTEVEAMAKLKQLPYATLEEALAEKFHCDLDFLRELNGEDRDLQALKPGDIVHVPNVEPFDASSVAKLPLLDKQGGKPNDKGEGKDSRQKRATENEATRVVVDAKDSMLKLYEQGRLSAAYPVTIGSRQTQSPQGEWKVKGIALLPDFRYDESFLKTGERSEEAHLLPPGPNNLVGVVWIALNKDGIGLHGTSEPDTIGRSTSHGCVRMANWDVVRLATRLRAGAAVSIQ